MLRRTVQLLTGVHNRTSVVIVLVALLCSGALIWRSSDAAFSSKATNPGDSWSAGQVSLTDDDAGAAMFSVTGLKPGSYGSKCIAVTYTGNVASSVKLYASASSGTLNTYLSVTVEQGTVGNFAGCGSFSGSTIYSGTLGGFISAKNSFATGVGSWTPSTNGTDQVYKISYQLLADNAAISLSSTCTFTWEAQNT
jgi:hypothetical protein